MFATEKATSATGKKLVAYVSQVLKDERDIVFASTPLEATEMLIDGVRWTYVFYESGLSVNVLYTLEDSGKRVVGCQSPSRLRASSYSVVGCSDPGLAAQTARMSLRQI